MNASTPEYTQVLAPEPVTVRMPPTYFLGEPIGGVECLPLTEEELAVLRMMMAGIPTPLAAETADFPVDAARELAAKFRIGADNTGIIFGRVAAGYKDGRTKAELERDHRMFNCVVKAALYHHQLEKPPGKAADPTWRREVTKLCINGCAIRKIAERNSCTVEEVRAAILYEGVLLSAIPGICIAKQRACAAMYPNISSEKIAAKLQISPPAVRAILKRSRIERIGTSGFAKLRYRADAFLGYGPATLYWLGFVFAEGHAQSKYKFALGLARADIERLYRFCEYLGTNNYPRIGEHEIKKKYPGRWYKNCRVDVCNSKVIGNLLSRGFRTGNRYCTMSDVVLEPLVRSSPYFLLGYFDGNGGISMTGHIQIGIRTPLQCVRDAYTEWLNKNAPGATTWKHQFHCWTLVLTGRRARALLNFLYFDEHGAPREFAMPRKLEEAKKYRSHEFREPKFGHLEIADILARRARRETGASIARRYRCSQSLICAIWKGRMYHHIIEDLRRAMPLPTAAR